MVCRFLLWLVAATAALAQKSGLVEGRLTNSVTHQGIPEARVTLTSLLGKTEYTARTDDSGDFRIANLPRGEYTARFQAAGFMDLEPGHPALRIFTVVPGRDPIRMELEFVPLGKVSGRVLDPDGRPMAGARIQFFHANHGSGYTTQSGKSGEFEVRWLIPGKYTLLASTTAPIPAGDGQPKAWAPTYFPNRLDRQDADLILVRGAIDLSGYDIRMQAVPVHSVRGNLFDPAGRLQAGVTVKALSNGNLTPEAQAVTGSDGEFEMPLRAGTWYLVAETMAEGKPYGATTVVVSRAAVEGVKVRLQRRFTLAGRAEGVPSAIYVYLIPAGWTFGEVPVSRIEPGVMLQFNGVVPGRYRIAVRGAIPPTSYLESIGLGEQDAMGVNVDLYEGAPPVRVVFRNDPGTVRGTVDGCHGATVMLIPQEEYLRSEVLTRSAMCEPSGRYEVSGLRPGAYYAFAFDRIGSLEGLQDRSLVSSLLPLASRVELRKGETTALDLKVTPWPE
jgi:hypothetical protein